MGHKSYGRQCDSVSSAAGVESFQKLINNGNLQTSEGVIDALLQCFIEVGNLTKVTWCEMCSIYPALVHRHRWLDLEYLGVRESVFSVGAGVFTWLHFLLCVLLVLPQTSPLSSSRWWAFCFLHCSQKRLCSPDSEAYLEHKTQHNTVTTQTTTLWQMAKFLFPVQ